MKRLILLVTIFVSAFMWACDGEDSTEITVTGPIADDAGKGLAWSAALIDLSKRGYVEEEFFYEGAAASYRIDGEMTADGLWSVSQADKKPFKSRLLVRRPEDPSKFNGTVVVEWFNVSAGADGAPGWMFNMPLLIREGYAWVGVSAQKVGVDGGGGMMAMPFGTSLTTYDPERYGSLVHPGDPYSYDIFSIAAKVIKGEGSQAVLGGLTAERLVAYGESQSAGTLITYVNAVQSSANVYDGIFIHSRGASGHPLGNGSGLSGGCGMSGGNDGGLKVRTDLDVPVMQFETEGDLVTLGFYPARQPDTEMIRTWEVAGTAHADYYLANYVNSAEIPENVPEAAEMFACESGNKGPQYIVVRAALKAFNTWLKDGIAPAKAEQVIEMNGSKIVRDQYGNALGGIRTPHVDVPIATLKPTGTPFADAAAAGGCNSGSGGGCDAITCAIFGSTVPFSEEKLLELYPTHEDYVTKFTASTQATVAAGFMLEEEAKEIIAEAENAAVPN